MWPVARNTAPEAEIVDRHRIRMTGVDPLRPGEALKYDCKAFFAPSGTGFARAIGVTPTRTTG